MISVTKRNGSKEPLDLNKFHRVVSWACEGINGVSESEIELKSRIQFYDGIKTTDIQETLIKAADDLINRFFTTPIDQIDRYGITRDGTYICG